MRKRTTECGESERHFIEEIGLFFEAKGLPRIAGRILGCLLITESDMLALDDLARILKASKASISNMSRMLVSLGSVEKASKFGTRKDYYRIRSDMGDKIIYEQIQSISTFQAILSRGLGCLPPKRAAGRARIESLYDLHTVYENALRRALVENRSRPGAKKSPAATDPA